MAFGGYSIDVPAARDAISKAESAWLPLHGFESKISDEFTSAGAAANDQKIAAALETAFAGCIRPLVVTMVISGRNTFTEGGNVVTTFENGDAQMGDAAAQRQAAENIATTTAGINTTPEYTHETKSDRPDPAPAKVP